jgi:hypothetical protein
MKKLMTLMLALSFMGGAVATVFAQGASKKEAQKKEGQKGHKGGKKSKKGSSGSTTPPPK